MEKNKALICNIDLFVINQTVICPDGHTESVDLNILPTYLTSYCHKNNILKIHLYGNEEYLNGLTEKILKEEETKYGKNNLIIERN